ncbi:MAG: uncharacterized protein JWN07_1696 [Hyphomicrobiales bacterium]|nr:uncharacterized protein [Hyphomicrobiales bacterium]
MAEYYPLLARAIAGLPQSTPETRRAIYERARTALIGQLRAVQPPIAEPDIQRESRMLDEAIARLEAEAPPTAPSTPASAPQSTAKTLPPPSEIRRSLDTLPRRSDTPMVRPSAQPPRPALPQRPSLPARPGSLISERPAGLGALDAARQRLASLAKPPVKPPGEPAKADEPQSVPSAPVEAQPQSQPVQSVRVAPPQAPSQTVQPSLPAVVTSAPTPAVTTSTARAESAPSDAPHVEAPKPSPTDAEIAVSRLAADAGSERRDPSAPINVTLRKYGPRAEAAGVSADLSAPDETMDEPRHGGVRPAAPLPPQEKERNFRPLLIGLPVALVVGAIAVFAYMRRDNPEDLARLRPAPGSETPAEQSVGKIVERIGGGQAARTGEQQTPAQPNANTPSNAQPAQPQQQTAPSNSPTIPVSQRAALLVDAPDEPQRVRTYVGNVVWRLDNVSRGPGQPLAIGVRAEIDLPDAKLKAVILIQKNTDETLPASHTIEVRFTPTDGGPVPGVSQISTPQMRKEDTPAGDALTGVPAPILRNFFLVGLTRGDTAATRNVDLIRNRGWIDIPMLLSDQRIAKITFEKGITGERVINEALEAWK